MASNYSLSALPTSVFVAENVAAAASQFCRQRELVVSRFDPLTATSDSSGREKAFWCRRAASAALPLVRLGHFCVAENVSGAFYTAFYTGEGF